MSDAQAARVGTADAQAARVGTADAHAARVGTVDAQADTGDVHVPRGRTVVSARAIQRVVRAVTAEQFEVQVRSVSADLADDAGRLALAVRTPIRVVPIERLQQDARAVERSGGSIVERAEQGERTIIQRVGSITGSAVSRVSLRFTAAEIRQERRVR